MKQIEDALEDGQMKTFPQCHMAIGPESLETWAVRHFGAAQMREKSPFSQLAHA